MDDNKKYNLLYTPELKPDRNYRSEATFKNKIEKPKTYTPPPEEPTLEDHIKELKEFEELVTGLPEDIFPLKDLTEKLRERAEIINIEDQLEEEIPYEGPGHEPGYMSEPEKEINDNIDIGTNSVPVDLPETIPMLFPSPTGIKVKVETPKTLVQMAQDAYRKDQLDLQKDYLRKMKLLLQKYFTNQLALTYNLNVGNLDSLTMDYDGEAVTGIPANLKHLGDTIIRSQLQRNQKKRFFDKLINTDQTLQHMRSWNAAEKARERYYEEAYGDSSKYIDSESNALLREARAGFDANYRNALYNMYKYLDSGAQMTEDILNHIMTESKAKAKLLQEGIDIYKTSAIEQNSGTGTTAVQAYTTEQLKSLEEARAANANKTIDLSKATPEQIDQAYGINSPASESEWGLSPTGGHWDTGDINGLISSDPNLYNASTKEGKEAIKVALSLTPKYIKADSNSVNNQISSSNSKNEQVQQESKSNVKEFFEQNKDMLIIH